MPAGVLEREGYRERGEAMGDHTAIRIFDVPWGIRQQFLEWAMGYSTNTLPGPEGGYVPVPAGVAAGLQSWTVQGGYVPAVAAVGYTDGQAQVGGGLGIMSRVIPAQHPERPWLYAQSYELQDGIGVVSQRVDITVPPGQNANNVDVNGDAGVQAAQNAVADLQTQVTTWTTFPLTPPNTLAGLTAFIGQLPPMPAAFADQFVNPAAAADVYAAIIAFEYDFILTAPSLDAIQQVGFLSQLRSAGPCGQFVQRVATLQQQLDAAILALAAAQAAAVPAALQAAIVPMIYYRARDNANAITQEGYARYAITYAALKFAIRSDADLGEMDNPASALPGNSELQRYVERDRTYSMKSFQILPNVANPLRFVGTVIDVPAAGSRLFPLTEWTYTWHQVPDVPEVAIDAVFGTINDSDFDGAMGCRSFPAGTMLCQQPDVVREPRNIRGRASHTIKFKFLQNKFGWNSFPTAQGNFLLATFGGGPPAVDDSNLVYKRSDFNKLFTVPLPVDYQVPGVG